MGTGWDDGTVLIVFLHNLLGDPFDPQELQAAVAGVALCADNIADEVVTKFGGRPKWDESDQRRHDLVTYARRGGEVTLVQNGTTYPLESLRAEFKAAADQLGG